MTSTDRPIDITLRVLGPPRLEVAGSAVHLTPRAFGVLLRLVLARGSVARDRILIDLWGDDVVPERKRSLETLVSRLRVVLGDQGAVVFERSSYRLAAHVRCDVNWLRTRLAQIEQAERSGDVALVQVCALAAKELFAGSISLAALGAGRWVDDLETELIAAQGRIEAVEEAISFDSVSTGVRYVVDGGGRHVAYSTVGDGGPDILLLGGLATHLEDMWSEPRWSQWVTRLAANNRVVLFDKRGTGLSDPVAAVPSADEFVTDALLVLDEVGSSQVVLVCCAEAGLFGPRLAVADAGRVAGVVFINAVSKMFRTADFSAGIPERTSRDFFAAIQEAWGSESVALDLAAPSLEADEGFLRWSSRYQRLCATPGSLHRLALFTAEADARDSVARLTQPALVMHTKKNRYFSPKQAEWLVKELPDGRLVRLEGADHLYWLPEPDRVLGEIQTFVAALSSR